MLAGVYPDRMKQAASARIPPSGAVRFVITMVADVSRRKRPPAQSLFCFASGECGHYVPEISPEERSHFAEHFIETFSAALGESRHEYLIQKK